MKNRFIILALVLAFVAGGAAFAQSKVEFSGQIELEMGSSFNSKDGTAFGASGVTGKGKGYSVADGDVQLIANITADEFNTGRVRIRHRTFTTFGGPASINPSATPTPLYDAGPELMLDQMFLTTNVGKALSLPFGWISKVGADYHGFAPAGNNRWQVLTRVLPRHNNLSDYFFDEVMWGTKQSLTFADMITLNGFFSLQGVYKSTKQPDRRNNQNGRPHNQLQDWWADITYAAPAGPGKLTVTAGYLVWSNNVSPMSQGAGENGYSTTAGEGFIFGNIGYTGAKIDAMTLDFGAVYFKPIDSDLGKKGGEKQKQSSIWATTATLDFGVMGSYFLVGAQGYPDWEKHAFHNLRFAAGVTPVKELSLDLGVILQFGDGTQWENASYVKDKLDDGILNTLDISACLNVGRAKYRIGYLFVPDGQAAIHAYQGDTTVNAELLKSCLYFKTTVRF